MFQIGSKITLGLRRRRITILLCAKHRQGLGLFSPSPCRREEPWGTGWGTGSAATRAHLVSLALRTIALVRQAAGAKIVITGTFSHFC